ncbi:S41 family peptidase [uncultured Algimonas sp.]|uniref:S41 family peptidase n=1 Tax=uncultured Algimonas sp. TaxID=1547920 RepID=UPI00263303AB|nr:S41 family peptidase [uncultured Algimonas sp.]
MGTQNSVTDDAPLSSALSETELYWRETIDPAAAQADLRALYEGLREAHFDLFANRSEAEHDALFAELDAALSEPVSRFDLFKTLQRFAAFGDVAHARIDFPSELWSAYRDRGGRALPLYPRIEGKAVYVGSNMSGLDEIGEGDRLIAIDGVPTGDWVDRMSRYISADTRDIATSLMEFTFPRDLWTLTGERPSHSVRVETADGTVRTIDVPTLTTVEQAANAEGDEGGSAGASLRESRLIGTTAYLKPGPFYNAEDLSRSWDNGDFVTFIDTAFETFLDAGATTLILDLRDNPGGDNSFSDPMLAWIADEPFRFYSEFRVRSSAQAEASNAARLEASGATEGPSVEFARLYAETPHGETFDFDLPMAQPRDGQRFSGPVYALINRNSYSNAVNVASILKDYGWATLAGEATTDFATTYGSMETFTLPESGFTVGFPKSLIVRPNGDTTPGPVYPDLALSGPLGSGQGDSMLDALLRHIEQG